MADRIVIMNGGEIAQAGTPQEVYNRPSSDFVAAFMGAENIIDLDVYVSGDRVDVAEGAHNGRASLSAKGRAVSSGRAIARFRSEAISLTAADDNELVATTGALLLKGIVEQSSYPGGLWRHVISLGASKVIVDAERQFEIGSTVHVRVPDEALFMFAKQ